ncbi:hypothetical protein [Halosegnis marinus]|uniref:Uncharacterized protein n=1 Tax=Halosegnis marinus TaxID=3034023 RepID=A0ABD5ZQE7_9EURY|nr:hypothetical protein [Halosegnis sp. DT85]
MTDIHSSHDLSAADALQYARTAEDAWTAGDGEACRTALAAGNDAVAAAARRATDEHLYRLVESTAEAVAAADDGVRLGADDAGNRVTRALVAVRHAANRLDPTAVADRDRMP